MESLLEADPDVGTKEHPIEVEIVENWRGGFSFVVVGSARPAFGNYATVEDARRVAVDQNYFVTSLPKKAA